jgi:hypothetical protein
VDVIAERLGPIAVWSDYHRDRGNRLLAARPGVPAPLVDISSPFPVIFGPALAVDPRGGALALWSDNDAGRVIAASYDDPAARSPAVTGLRVSPSGFRARARVIFDLDVAAYVGLAIDRVSAGRRVGGRCVKPNRRANRGKASCIRYVRMRLFTAPLPAGHTGLRLDRAGMAPGVYRLTATPTANGVAGLRARARFRILR